MCLGDAILTDYTAREHKPAKCPQNWPKQSRRPGKPTHPSILVANSGGFG